MNKKTSAEKTATVFTDYDGKFHSISYVEISDLLSSVNELLTEHYPGVFDDDVRITLSDTQSFMWNYTIAHYCFGEGRITEQEAVEAMLEEKKGVAL